MSDNEKKPRSNRVIHWLGIIILVGLLAMLGQYLYWKYKEGVNNRTINLIGQSHNNQLSSAIHEYVQWTDTLPNQKMNENHELISTGLHKIAAVLAAFPDSTANGRTAKVQADIDTIRSMADSITYNKESARHASMIKKAFSKILEAARLLHLDRSDPGRTQLSALQMKTDSISEETLTLKQKNAVKAAFQQTAAVFSKTATR